ncbi:MAG: nickel-dependent lactate racemase [Gammaproteobacteria bacterium]|nr:nickel-dependent lactate racemase [Gammaproteobacteria bacterium]MXW06692.1 nickel-dependent lactate racemase [Gammaproteobacteria bacterium]
MIVSLQYGKSGLQVTLPPNSRVSIVEKPSIPVLRNPARTINSALDSGVDSPSLRQLASQCRTACILVCDITRPVPNQELLPPIIETLLNSGIAHDNILLLVATGLHRPNEGEELQSIIGNDPILNSIPVANHVARSDHSHVDLGYSSRQTPVKLDRRFVEAELKLVVGLVEPHFMAGFSGGRKVIVPGIAHEDTIRTLHSSKFLSDPNCAVCKVAENPLHAELLEIVEQLRQHSCSSIYGVNVVIDANRQLVFMNFGEVETSHEEAMDFSRRMSIVALDRQFPIVLSTAAGFPLDQTFYQAIKGIVTPLDIVEPNGTLILAAECKEGLGSQPFQQAQEKLCLNGTDAFLRALSEKNQADIDEWSTQMLALARQRARIMLYSEGLTEAQFELTGTQGIPSIETGLEIAGHAIEPLEIAVIPEGPYVVPQLST